MKGKGIRPGILCMIINARLFPKNEGKVVTVIRSVQAGEKVNVGGEVVEIVSSAGEPSLAWLVEGEDLEYEVGGRRRVGPQRALFERFLLPLNDPDAELETEEAKEIKA